jgi:23S rRNA maturation-related 3'-5' exoribonuclease YhaM
MKMYTIEIDEKIWGFLQKHAEPFIDTPNSVLNQILFDASKKTDEQECVSVTPEVKIQGAPKSLSQILEVIYEMEVNGYSRTEATNRVAQKRGTAPQTITDKYCRQIGKKAHEIDQLLSETGYKEFKALLKEKFVAHQQVIDTYFETLMMGVG